MFYTIELSIIKQSGLPQTEDTILNTYRYTHNSVHSVRINLYSNSSILNDLIFFIFSVTFHQTQFKQ